MTEFYELDERFDVNPDDMDMNVVDDADTDELEYADMPPDDEDDLDERFSRTAAEREDLLGEEDFGKSSNKFPLSDSDLDQLIVFNVSLSATVSQLEELVSSKLSPGATIERTDGMYLGTAVVKINPSSEVVKVASNLHGLSFCGRNIVARKMSRQDFYLFERKRESADNPNRGYYSSRPPKAYVNVTNVNAKVSENDLLSLFQKKARGVRKVIMKPVGDGPIVGHHSGRGRVLMHSINHAIRFCKVINGTNIAGRRVIARVSSASDGERLGPPKVSPHTSLICATRYNLKVSGVPVEVSAKELEEIFSSEVGSEVRATLDPADGGAPHGGAGVLQFKNEDAARSAYELLNGSDIGGQCIELTLDISNEERPSCDTASDALGSTFTAKTPRHVGDCRVGATVSEPPLSSDEHKLHETEFHDKDSSNSGDPKSVSRNKEAYGLVSDQPSQERESSNDRSRIDHNHDQRLEDDHSRRSSDKDRSCRSSDNDRSRQSNDIDRLHRSTDNDRSRQIVDGDRYHGRSSDRGRHTGYRSRSPLSSLPKHDGVTIFREEKDLLEHSHGSQYRLQVSNISYSVHARTFIDHVNRRVSGLKAVVLRLDHKGASSGVMILDFSSRSAVDEFMKQMEGYSFSNRKIVIKPDYGRRPYSPARFSRTAHRLGSPDSSLRQGLLGPPLRAVAPGAGLMGAMPESFSSRQQISAVAPVLAMPQPVLMVQPQVLQQSVDLLPGAVMQPVIQQQQQHHIQQQQQLQHQLQQQQQHQIQQQQQATATVQRQVVSLPNTSSDRNTETFGLSMQFLDSLHIKLPLTKDLLVTNLDRAATESDIKDLFSIAGTLKNIQYNRSNGQAILEMAHPVEAVQAISMLHNQIYFDKVLGIRMLRPNDPDVFLARSVVSSIPRGLKTIGKGLGIDGMPLATASSGVDSSSVLKQSDHSRGSTRKPLLGLSGGRETYSTSTEQRYSASSTHDSSRGQEQFSRRDRSPGNSRATRWSDREDSSSNFAQCTSQNREMESWNRTGRSQNASWRGSHSMQRERTRFSPRQQDSSSVNSFYASESNRALSSSNPRDNASSFHNVRAGNSGGRYNARHRPSSITRQEPVTSGGSSMQPRDQAMFNRESHQYSQRATDSVMSRHSNVSTFYDSSASGGGNKAWPAPVPESTIQLSHEYSNARHAGGASSRAEATRGFVGEAKAGNRGGGGGRGGTPSHGRVPMKCSPQKQPQYLMSSSNVSENGRTVLLFSLPANAKQQTIIDMCLPYGSVSNFVLDNSSRTARVVFATCQQATMAADILNNHVYNGSTIKAMHM